MSGSSDHQGGCVEFVRYHYYLSVSTIEQQSTATPPNYLISTASHCLFRALANDTSPPAGDLSPDMFSAIIYLIHLLE